MHVIAAITLACCDLLRHTFCFKSAPSLACQHLHFWPTRNFYQTQGKLHNMLLFSSSKGSSYHDETYLDLKIDSIIHSFGPIQQDSSQYFVAEKDNKFRLLKRVPGSLKPSFLVKRLNHERVLQAFDSFVAGHFTYFQLPYDATLQSLRSVAPASTLARLFLFYQVIQIVNKLDGTHGNITTDNVFWKGTDIATNVMLGDVHRTKVKKNYW